MVFGWLKKKILRAGVKIDDAVGPRNMNRISDFAAGFGDTMTADATTYFRKSMGWNDVVDPNSTAYIAGGATETAIELYATGGMALARRKLAKQLSTAVGRKALNNARKRGVSRAERLLFGKDGKPAGLEGHHIRPVKGHPGQLHGRIGGKKSWYPRPDLADNPRNIKFLTRADHLKAHKRLILKENIDRVRTYSHPVRLLSPTNPMNPAKRIDSNSNRQANSPIGDTRSGTTLSAPHSKRGIWIAQDSVLNPANRNKRRVTLEPQFRKEQQSRLRQQQLREQQWRQQQMQQQRMRQNMFRITRR